MQVTPTRTRTGDLDESDLAFLEHLKAEGVYAGVMGGLARCTERSTFVMESDPLRRSMTR
jgi:hypothetical protein